MSAPVVIVYCHLSFILRKICSNCNSGLLSGWWWWSRGRCSIGETEKNVHQRMWDSSYFFFICKIH